MKTPGLCILSLPLCQGTRTGVVVYIFSDIDGLTVQATTAATYLQFGPMEPTLPEDHRQLPRMINAIPLF